MEEINRYLQQDGTEKFREIVQKTEIQSKSDPENEPYRSKYHARVLLSEMLSYFESLRDFEDTVFWISAINLKLGANYIDTEELSTGQEHLEKCITALEAHNTHEKACHILQQAYNQMGILWCTRRNPQKANEYLKTADELYHMYKKDIGSTPWNVDDLFLVDPEDDLAKVSQKRSEDFENCFTHTLYYLAQVHKQLGDSEKSAEYCHMTLRRQLEAMNYDCLDWSLNCATLSQYYLTQQHYRLARHCLASAQSVLGETGEPNLKCSVSESDGQADVNAKEKLPRAWADLYRCWVKYGISLLEDSMDKLLDNSIQDSDINDSETTSERNHESAENEILDKDTVQFNLEITSLEEAISDKRVVNFEQAREIFIVVQKWINTSKEFYVLDGYCGDHIELVQDHSKLYKLLAFFEPDFERQSKMHKRRIDMLEAILPELNPQFYLMICRQLMFELAETYSAMMDLKLAILESSDSTPTPHQVKKVNQLVGQSIAKYEQYVDSLRKPDKSLPPQYSSDDERPAIVAHFCLGRLYSKYIEIDPVKRVKNMTLSWEYYSYFKEYCHRNPSTKEHSKSECDICEEMSSLLPLKIAKFKAENGL